jgi:hypothetical protein
MRFIQAYEIGGLSQDEAVSRIVSESVVIPPEDIVPELDHSWVERVKSAAFNQAEPIIWGLGMDAKVVERIARRYREGAKIWQEYFNSH